MVISGVKMEQFLDAKVIMSVVLVGMVVAALWTITRRDRNSRSGIKWDDLLLGEDGRLSKAAVVMMGAFALTTWMMVYLTLTDKMSEGYFTIFGALWATPAVTKLIVNRPSVVGKSVESPPREPM
jgi:hypothetical protein